MILWKNLQVLASFQIQLCTHSITTLYKNLCLVQLNGEWGVSFFMHCKIFTFHCPYLKKVLSSKIIEEVSYENDLHNKFGDNDFQSFRYLEYVANLNILFLSNVFIWHSTSTYLPDKHKTLQNIFDNPLPYLFCKLHRFVFVKFFTWLLKQNHVKMLLSFIFIFNKIC